MEKRKKIKCKGDKKGRKKINQVMQKFNMHFANSKTLTRFSKNNILWCLKMTSNVPFQIKLKKI